MGANISKVVATVAPAGITILMDIILWKIIKWNKTTLAQLKEAKEVRYGFMKAHLKSGTTESYNYACVEGVVSPDCEKLCSGGDQEKKVVLRKRLNLKEMLWLTLLRGVTGRWLDVTENFDTVPFHLRVEEKRGDEPIKVSITDPSEAVIPMPGLKILIETCRQEAPLSLVLPAKTTLIAFGKVTLADNGKITMEPPASSECCYILTGMTRGELLGTFEDKIRWLKVLAVAVFLIGGGITIYMIYSDRRRQRLNAQPGNTAD